MTIFASYVIWFMIYSFIGWIYESGLRSITHRRWYNSGFLNGPYIPIYGAGAVLDIFFLSSLNDPFLIFLLAAIINCILEYMTGWIMELLFHARWWDYSKKPLNINGRVYIGGFIAFGLFALIVVLYFHPWLKAHTTDTMDIYALTIWAAFIILLIATDTVITVLAMKDFEEKVEALASALEEARQHIDDKIDSLPDPDRVRNILSRFNFAQRRLLNAFPHLKFDDAHYTAEEITAMIKENTRKLFH